MRESTEDLEHYQYTRVLERTETFFWFFCDNYLELVKSRRYGDHGEALAASANTALLTALSVFLRLFAPFLPFATEEIWSWWQPGSVHKASWPTEAEILAVAGGADDRGVQALQMAARCSGDIRKKKSEEQRPLKTPVARIVIRAPEDKLELLPDIEQDLRASGPDSADRHARLRSAAGRRRTGTAGGCAWTARMRTIPFEPLDPSVYRQIVRRALAEDLGWGDVTTEATVGADVRGYGTIVVKMPCVLAGLDVAAEAFRQLDPAVHITLRNRDGDRCEAGVVAAEVRGAAALMLTAERTALNFLQRLSGIATLTRRFVDAADGRITVLDTRKTTPTLRALEKYAVRAGGGSNHRSGLDDGILIKDNHVRLAGGVGEAVKRMKAARQEMLIEVEAQSLADVEAAIDAAADVILLDNLPLEQIHQAVARIAGRAKIEISGGVSLDRMPELARTGADYVSIGALTHSAPAVDLSFEIELDA